MASDSGKPMPKWRKSPEELARTFEAAVKPMPGAELRKMFGYPCAFVNGQMFAGLHQENMIVRLGPEERAAFLALPGASQFEPMAGRPMREYVVFPPEVIEAPGELSAWLEKGIAYAAALPAKVAKAKAPRKRGG
jgi:TfoX/Sxy family transcriptional regulator of competence genes